MNIVTTASAAFLPPLRSPIQEKFQSIFYNFQRNFPILQYNNNSFWRHRLPDSSFSFISSARLRSLILKKHLTTLNAQLRTDKKADPHLTRMILLNMFQIFQITRINFDQYLHIHKHPDTYSTQRDATTQTEHTTIKPKRLVRNLSNRMRSEMEKQRLNSYWPSDDNDDTDEELQKDPPEALIDDNYPHKTYTYVSF